MWSIRLVVFAKQDLKHMISHVQQSSVKTGIANALGEFSTSLGNNFNFLNVYAVEANDGKTLA